MHKLFIRFLQISETIIVNYINFTFELGGDEDAYLEGVRHIEVDNQF